jgi:L-aspartate oxidase
LEVVVFAKRIVERARERLDGSRLVSQRREQDCFHLSERRGVATMTHLSLLALQSLMWDRVGITRSGVDLEEAASTLAAWHGVVAQPSDRPSYELDNMVLLGRLMAEAALIREESRGAHFRSDFPEPLPGWQRHVIFRKNPS